MFGYVRSISAALSEEQQNQYESFYCGLCHLTGRQFGRWSRLLLNYDMAFLSLFGTALSQESSPACSLSRCVVNPLLKKNCAPQSEALSFGAGVGMLLFYYKIKDNLSDQKGIKRMLSLFLLPLASRGRQKALPTLVMLDRQIGEQMERQQMLETENCSDIDRACAPSAEALGHIFASLDPPQSALLFRFGFLLGRWVYLVDAIDDFEKDLRSGSYNVFSFSFPQCSTRKELSLLALPSLNRTLGALAAAYQSLSFCSYQGLLDHIIYLGLPTVQRAVLAGTYHTPSKKTSTLPAKENIT